MRHWWGLRSLWAICLREARLYAINGYNVSVLELVALIYFHSATHAPKHTHTHAWIHGSVNEVCKGQVNCEHQVLIMQDRKLPLQQQSYALWLCVSAPHPTPASYITQHRQKGRRERSAKWWNYEKLFGRFWLICSHGVWSLSVKFMATFVKFGKKTVVRCKNQ